METVFQVAEWICEAKKDSYGVFLILRMNMEECVNVHALCLERRTRVLEVNFLNNPHYGVWGRYNMTFVET